MTEKERTRAASKLSRLFPLTLVMWATVAVTAEASRPAPPETEILPLEECAAELKSFLEAHPDSSEAYHQLGNLYLRAYAHNRRFFAVEVRRRDDQPLVVSDSDRNPILLRSELTLPVSSQRLRYLADAILAYRQSLALSERRIGTRVSLGHAYAEVSKRCLEEDWPREEFVVDALIRSLFAGRAEAANHDDNRPRYWEDLALQMYREALALNEKCERALEERKPEWKAHAVDYVDLEVATSAETDRVALGMYRVLCHRQELSEDEEKEALSIQERAIKAARDNNVGIDFERFPVQSDVPPEKIAAMRQKYPDVPLQENGAEYFLHAADAYVAPPRKHPPSVSALRDGAELPVSFLVARHELKLPPGPFSEEDLRWIEQYLHWNEESLRLAHQTASFSQFAYPRDFYAPWRDWSSGSAGLGDVACLLEVNSLYEAEQGHGAEASRALVDLLALARSGMHEPSGICQNEHRRMGTMALECLERVVNRVALEDRELAALQQAMAKVDVKRSMLGTFEGGRWFYQALPPVSDDEVRETVIRSKNVIIDINTVLTAEQRKVSEEEFQAERQKKSNERRTLQEEVTTIYDALIELTQQPFSEIYAQVRMPEDHKPGSPAPPFFGSDMFSGIRRGCLSALRFEAYLRVAQASLAVERYRLARGVLPGSIDAVAGYCTSSEAIIDPYNDQRLNYSEDDGKFVVSSTGDRLYNRMKQRRQPDAPEGVAFTVSR